MTILFHLQLDLLQSLCSFLVYSGYTIPQIIIVLMADKHLELGTIIATHSEKHKELFPAYINVTKHILVCSESAARYDTFKTMSEVFCGS